MALSLSETSRIVVSRDQVSCDLAGEAAILNLGSGIYFGLDVVGARVWNAIQQPITFGELREILAEEYDVGRVQLENDLRSLLSDLVNHGLVEIAK